MICKCDECDKLYEYRFLFIHMCEECYRNRY